MREANRYVWKVKSKNFSFYKENIFFLRNQEPDQPGPEPPLGPAGAAAEGAGGGQGAPRQEGRGEQGDMTFVPLWEILRIFGTNFPACRSFGGR